MQFMRTAVLLAAMTALFLMVGALLGGRGGMAIALLFAVGTNLYAYWNSDRMALAAVDAREVADEAAAPELVGLVRGLSARAGLLMPRLFLVDSPQPNAFATGRDPAHAALAVNTGLLQMLTGEELAGVIGHELAHVRNRDTLTMTITATLAGAISSIAHWGFFFGGGRRNGLGFFGSIAMAILAPLAAMVVQMAVSRGREYEADRDGAEICGNPLWLASALAKIADAAQRIPDEAVEAHPAMAHLFTVNPLSGRGMDSLFSTHPAVENRIAALEDLARSMGATWHAAPQPAAPPREPAQEPAYESAGGWQPFRQPTETPRPPGTFLGGRGLADSPWNRGRSSSAQGPWG